jgi:hypothetical protein
MGIDKTIREIESARKKKFEKTLPTGETFESVKKKMIKELQNYLIFLENYILNIFTADEGIETKIENIKIKTGQNIKKEQLIKELWILRYALLHLWFFEIVQPKSQNDLEAYISLINRALQDIKGTSDFLPWLAKGYVEYAGTSQLKFSDLNKLKPSIEGKMLEKIQKIAVECTEGRFGGELHDFVIELLMTTIAEDKETFGTGERKVISEEESKNIKKSIEEIKTEREKITEQFLDNLVDKN